MSQLPKLVRERLRVSVPPAGHPDPDVLTAFSEQSLPPHERAAVMEHLARCGNCRDVLALALPPSESGAADDEVPAAQKDWFSWPVLRWGFAAAGFLIVAGIGVLQYQRHSRPTEMAYYKTSPSNQADQTPPETSRDQSKPASPPTPLKASPALVDRATVSPTAVEPAPERTPSPVQDELERSKEAGAAANSFHGGVNEGQNQRGGEPGTKLAMNLPPKDLFSAPSKSASPEQTKQIPSRELEQKVALPPASETVEVQSQATAVTTQGQVEGQLQEQQLDLPQAQQQRANNNQVYVYAEGDKTEGDKTMKRAKPVPPSAPGAPAPSPQPVVTGRAELSLRAPSWTISSMGGLQRSFDGGKNWEDVNVNEKRGMTGEMQFGAVSGALAKDSRAAGNKKEKTDKTTQPASAVPVFRAVAANGLEVWAGGSGGALYHSVDGGGQWTRIFPMVDSVLLTGDIASIQFSDSQHGTVATATSEVWTTSDAGHSWQRH